MSVIFLRGKAQDLFISVVDFENFALEKIGTGKSKFRPWKMRLHRDLFSALFNPCMSAETLGNWWMTLKLHVACEAVLEAHDLKPHDYIVKPKRKDMASGYNRVEIVRQCGHHLLDRLSVISELIKSSCITGDEHKYILSCEFVSFEIFFFYHCLMKKI